MAEPVLTDVKCAPCNGTGRRTLSGRDRQKCEFCHGRGSYTVAEPITPPGPSHRERWRPIRRGGRMTVRIQDRDFSENTNQNSEG